MWQTIIFSLLLSIMSEASEKNTHLHELNKLFPYALLTDDFGILNKDDLKINQCIAEPSPFSEEGGNFYPYWQCLELKDVEMICEGRKYSSEEKSRMTMLVISATRNGELNEFISRRPMKLKLCHLYLKDWKKFTKNEKHVCISGSSMSSKNNKTGQKKKTWIFDRYKTNKGCDAYFRGTCIPAENTMESCVVD